MLRLAQRFAPAESDAEPDDATRAALDQAARELLLAQSSDWAFIINSSTSVPYAMKRLREHLTAFHRLADSVEAGRPDSGLVEELRARDAIFPWLDYRIYAA
jgi:1,4-alpha-glucan branching enzyme